MLAYFLRGFVLGIAAAAQPGPFQAYLLARSARNGWRQTLPAALAPLLSDGPITVLVLLVLTQMPATLLDLLRVVGGLFICYLARGAWQAFRAFETPQAAPERAARQSVLEAALMNLLNPNPYLFWSAVGGPILLDAWRLSALHGLVYLLGFYGTMIGGSALLIVLFATTARLGAEVNRALVGLSALALMLFGLYQIASGVSRVAGYYPL